MLTKAPPTRGFSFQVQSFALTSEGLPQRHTASRPDMSQASIPHSVGAMVRA